MYDYNTKLQFSGTVILPNIISLLLNKRLTEWPQSKRNFIFKFGKPIFFWPAVV